MGGLTVFFFILSSAVHDSLFLHPTTHVPTIFVIVGIYIVYLPTCSRTPGTDYIRNLDAAAAYTLIFFFGLRLSLSFSLSLSIFLFFFPLSLPSIPIRPSLFYRRWLYTKSIIIHISTIYTTLCSAFKLNRWSGFCCTRSYTRVF